VLVFLGGLRVSRPYGVYRCGPKRDVLVARRVRRREAAELARRLNRDRRAPLHYVYREAKG